MPTLTTQRALALGFMKSHGMSRLRELMETGVTAATVSRLEREGEIVRLARGLYQLADATVDTNHSLAQAAKLVPRGVVCLTSALAFHGLTDQLPAKVWIAIGPKERRPTLREGPPLRFVRFSGAHLTTEVKRHRVDGVSVPIFSVAKTLADLFRYRRTVGIEVALEGLRETLRQKKATPAELARQANAAGVWPTMEPYLMALTVGG